MLCEDESIYMATPNMKPKDKRANGPSVLPTNIWIFNMFSKLAVTVTFIIPMCIFFFFFSKNDSNPKVHSWLYSNPWTGKAEGCQWDNNGDNSGIIADTPH